MKQREKEENRIFGEVHKIAEEVEHDPKVAEQAEEDQRRFGTLTGEDLVKIFTI